MSAAIGDIGRRLATGARRLSGLRGSSNSSGDRIFASVLALAAALIVLLLLALGVVLAIESRTSLTALGLHFFANADWDPVNDHFGALPFIYGTLVSATLALMIAVPLSLGVALCLSEMAPRWISFRLGFLVELLAAIPSVIYGLWALFVLGPWVRDTVEPLLQGWLGFLPLFQGPRLSVGMLTAGIVLGVMVIPYISAVSTDVFRAVPSSQREAALALGATKWETVRMAVLPYGFSGLVGAVILGLGRALGETIAVAMVIGNRPEISASLLMPSSTLASAIANEFTEATSDIYLSAIVELGLTLLLLELIVTAVARGLIFSTTRNQFAGRT